MPANPETSNAETMELVLTAVRMAARDTNLYTFERADRGPLPGVEPGAHIGVILPNGIERQYSLIESGASLSQYTVGVKRDAQSRGGSVFMHDQLRVGSKVAIVSPRNNFPLKEDAELVCRFHRRRDRNHAHLLHGEASRCIGAPLAAFLFLPFAARRSLSGGTFAT